METQKIKGSKRYKDSLLKVDRDTLYEIQEASQLLNNLPKDRFYFAHSYYLENINDEFILCDTKHNITFPSSINYENIYGYYRFYFCRSFHNLDFAIFSPRAIIYSGHIFNIY